MKTGYIKLIALAEMLKTIQHVSFKMILQNKGGQWLLHILVVDVLPDKLQKQAPSYCYDYGVVIFLAGVLSGADVSGWLLNKGGNVNGYDFQYRMQQEVTDVQLNWTTHPSYANIGFAKTEYPFTLYRMPLHSNEWGLPTDFLVGDHCPFFPNIQAAIKLLIYGITDPYDNRNASEEVSIRIFHTAARIQHIEISPTLLTIDVEGTDLSDTQLQINGPPELQVYEYLSEAKRIDCLLPNGLPPDTWVVLSRSNEWLDYVYLGQSRSPFGSRQDNITVSPPDMRTQIQELIAQGEGLTVEFKEEIPQNHDKMLKTVAAFANGNGGVILLGVTNDGEIVGLRIAGNIDQEKGRIINMIRNVVSPDPEVRIEHCHMDGEGTLVIAIVVDKGTSPLYGLHYDKLEVYVRRQATTFRARPEEIVTLVQVKEPRGIYHDG